MYTVLFLLIDGQYAAQAPAQRERLINPITNFNIPSTIYEEDLFVNMKGFPGQKSFFKTHNPETHNPEPLVSNMRTFKL